MYLSPGWPEEEDRKIGGQELELGDQGTIHSGEKNTALLSWEFINQMFLCNISAVENISVGKISI